MCICVDGTHSLGFESLCVCVYACVCVCVCESKCACVCGFLKAIPLLFGSARTEVMIFNVLVSSVSMMLTKEDVVAKTPGQKDYYIKTVLGGPRLIDVEKAEGGTMNVWDWRLFLSSGKFNVLNDEGYIFDRQTVWEVWTVIEDINTSVFDIKFSGV